jgi:PrtD family type I secretion system ABC transporter
VNAPSASAHLGMNQSSELSAALTGGRGLLVTMLMMSAVLNGLLLSGAMFMLLVYDEVLPSRSAPSLVGLLVIVCIAYAFQAAIEQFRNRMMLHVGEAFDQTLSERIFSLVLGTELSGGQRRDAVAPVRDMDQIRSFLSGTGPMALLDLPWMVLFLGLLFAFHPTLGILCLAGAAVLVALTILTDRMTRNQVESATRAGAERQAYVEACRRNVEIIRALGMTSRSVAGWTNVSRSYLDANSDVSGKISLVRTLSKTFRMLLQSLILACGAWLVINDQATGGVIIASSILSSRALAPIELAISNWRSFIAARQSWNRLAATLQDQPLPDLRTPLPRPFQSLRVENLAAVAPGTQTILFRDISFTLNAGDTLAIVGPSGSGKSSFVRALVGVLPPGRGAVRLDGAALDQWDHDLIGQHLGYLPQDIELFDGSVAQNISRFDPTATSEEIISAARNAGVHDLIVRLPNGYDTVIGPNGRNLSAGQRQRIALARALFGDPFLIVLDEPNSNLDANGEAALNQAIATARDRGAIVIIVAHRPSALTEVETLLWLVGGVVKAYGPKQDVLARVNGTSAPNQVPTAAVDAKLAPVN